MELHLNLHLSLLIWLPLVGGLAVLGCWRQPELSRWLTLAVTAVVFVYSLILFAGFPAQTEGWYGLTDLPWIPDLGASFRIGIDGIALVMILLTAFLLLVAVPISWSQVKERIPLFHALLLFMEAGIMGVFLSLDLLLFYIFWEVMLIPMFFLIGIWGHGRRLYAAVKFFLFTLAGSLLMLLAIITLYLMQGEQSGNYSFALEVLRQTEVPTTLGLWLFGAFFLAFAVKVPLWPVHTWLPDAHTEAPTAGSVILAGILLKTGVYGLIRFGIPLFPEAAMTLLPLMILLAMVGIFYGGWVAYLQEDAKRLVAYSSVAHLGYVMLGLACWQVTAVDGSMLQMVNHGISTGALFMLVGMIYERSGTREIAKLGGVWQRTPVLGGFLLFFSMASLGLPGLNNFAGEILILIGAFQTNPLIAMIAIVGVLFAAIYTLKLVIGVLWGTPPDDREWADVNLREGLVLTSFALLVLWLGLYPTTFLEPMQGAVRALLVIGGAAGGVQ